MVQAVWERDLEVPDEGLRFTIVIPSYQSARSIGWTLKSLEMQDYPEIEVVVVDAGSTDATLEVVQRSRLQRIRIYSVAEYNLFDMINRGISLATGRYVGFLVPGCAYLSKEAIRHIRSMIHTHKDPDLIYSGALLRDPLTEPQVLLRTLSSENLKRGLQPSSYQACWYRIDILRKLGKLNADYQVQGGFDLFCRLAKREDLKTVFTERVLVDRDLENILPITLVKRSWETSRIIKKHFGWVALFRWTLRQNLWRIIRLWWRSKRPLLWS